MHWASLFQPLCSGPCLHPHPVQTPRPEMPWKVTSPVHQGPPPLPQCIRPSPATHRRYVCYRKAFLLLLRNTFCNMKVLCDRKRHTALCHWSRFFHQMSLSFPGSPPGLPLGSPLGGVYPLVPDPSSKCHSGGEVPPMSGGEGATTFVRWWWGVPPYEQTHKVKTLPSLTLLCVGFNNRWKIV